MSDYIDTIEQFHGVYLLYCLNPKFKGRTYIGYTVDPNRRIKQHNKGRKAGGAWKTSKKGPWSMVLIVHGFPNAISALRFEWAWQHPGRSRRLNHITKKRNKESVYDYTLRILSEMFQTGPWNRLPLTIKWLNQEYQREFPGNRLPPLHMPFCYGTVIAKKLTSVNENHEKLKNKINTCVICSKTILDKPLHCVKPTCSLISHLWCLAEYYLEDGEYVPVEGCCPVCNQTFLWGDYIRKYKGCYENLDIVIDTDLALEVSASDSE
ncbi:hypothetical protein RN001_010975 [Aquatica leii]|uniref:Structure-specific endonuclease subunit SLX1 homolog n=1 Tax=Aquatica leii TaxID=1421715 RepID=A0AAN7P7G0_9COLE|nr:hypothetical protein RN001_010975 [Aquatica leii]